MRLLIFEVSDDSELSIALTSDDFASWELAGIATWLASVATSDMSEEESDSD